MRDANGLGRQALPKAVTHERIPNSAYRTAQLIDAEPSETARGPRKVLARYRMDADPKD